MNVTVESMIAFLVWLPVKNTLGSFNCSCNHGYIGDGKTNCTEAPGKIIDNFTLCAFCFTEVAIGFVFL